MITVDKSIRSIFGIIVIVILIVMVMSFLGAYKHASGSEGESKGSSETTASAESTPTGSTQKDKGSDNKTATVPESKGIGTVSVIVDGLNFRVEPSRDSELIRGLDAGEKLTLLEEIEGWYKVQDASNQVGYVSSSSQYTSVEK